MENQIFFVHGGMTFKKRNEYLNYLKTKEIRFNKEYWSDKYLKNKLKNVEIIKPRMPLQDNAKYEDWKIYFERHFSFLKDNIILIGSSLGGIFLAKYLSENKFPKKILSLYLICPPYDNTLPSEDLVNGFKLKSNISLIEKNVKKIYLMFSKDDDVVPLNHSQKYRKKLKNAKLIIYENKNGHFKIKEFPEIIKLIKEDLKSIK
jgi:uncharacterized protein